MESDQSEFTNIVPDSRFDNFHAMSFEDMVEYGKGNKSFGPNADELVHELVELFYGVTWSSLERLPDLWIESDLRKRCVEIGKHLNALAGGGLSGERLLQACIYRVEDRAGQGALSIVATAWSGIGNFSA